MTNKNITIDAKGMTLGRLATKVALTLRGKDRPTFEPHIDPEITVKVVNVSDLSLTGLKMDDKRYHRHTGYPGNQKVENPRQIIDKKGHGELLRRAVRGMLPPNRLRARFLKRLVIEK